MCRTHAIVCLIMPLTWASGCSRKAGQGEMNAGPSASSASRKTAVAESSVLLPPNVLLPKKPGEVRFVAMGDTGKGNEGQRMVADAAHAFCMLHGCDFVLLLGDNIYESGVSGVDDPLWQSRFEQPYAAFSQPFYAVLGNHDYGHAGLGDVFERGAFQVAYSARSSKWRMPAAHYRLHVGAIEILGLDTNLLMWGRDDGQTEAMRSWTSAHSLPWRIVAGHHPYLSNGPHGNVGAYNGAPASATTVNGASLKHFFDDEVCGRSDIYLSAHDHTREWLEPTCKGTELIVSGTGASPTRLKGSNPSRFSTAELGFVYLMGTSTELRAQMVNARGEVEYARTLKK